MNNTFISNPTGLSRRTYGVSVKYFKGDESNPYKRIDYEACIKLEQQKLGWLMCLNKENVFFNQHEPDTISERFASMVSQSLYPVETVINGWGKQVGGITNHEAIMMRWKQNRIKFVDKYKGEVVDNFVKVVDNKIKNSSYIQRSMNHDLFWNLFFHPKYMSYTETYTQTADLYLAIVPYKDPFRFSGQQKIFPEVTDYHSVRVKFASDELMALNELLPDNKKGDRCFMKVNADFDLDENHHFAMHTRAVFEMYEREGTYTLLPVRKIQFTMYQIQDK